MKQISEIGVVKTLENIEAAKLSDNFWDVAVVQDLAYTSTVNPTYLVYLAAQVAMNDMSLLSNNTSVRFLIEMRGDVHHIFPREYLKKNGFKDRWQYNQVANYTYLDTGVNISIGMKAPNDYFLAAFQQCTTGDITVGTITDSKVLVDNLAANCIPTGIETMSAADYPTFLRQRRIMMAQKIKDYYYSL